MRKLISTTLLGLALSAAGCASTMNASNVRSKTVRTTWTCPAGTAPDPANMSPNCSARTPVAQVEQPKPAPVAKQEAPNPKVALLERVEFETGSSVLSEAAKGTLDEVAGALRADPTVLQIRIVGRTDNTGTEALNDQLSQERADAVKIYLQNHGVASEKVDTQALGEKAPLAPNETADGRALNRSAAIVAMK